jgi:hypothetical protein
MVNQAIFRQILFIICKFLKIDKLKYRGIRDFIIKYFKISFTFSSLFKRKKFFQCKNSNPNE